MDEFEYENIIVRSHSREVPQNGSPIPFTTMKFDVLYFLISNPNIAFTKEQVYEAVMKDSYKGKRLLLFGIGILGLFRGIFISVCIQKGFCCGDQNLQFSIPVLGSQPQKNLIGRSVLLAAVKSKNHGISGHIEQSTELEQDRDTGNTLEPVFFCGWRKRSGKPIQDYRS